MNQIERIQKAYFEGEQPNSYDVLTVLNRYRLLKFTVKLFAGLVIVALVLTLIGIILL